MTHPIPIDELDATDAELMALDALIAQGDDADLPEFRSWWDSDSPLTFATWLLALPDDEKEAA